MSLYGCGHYSEYMNTDTNEGPLCLIEAIEPSEYSYFAPAVLASWAGPLHWKINRQNAQVKKGTKYGGPQGCYMSVFEQKRVTVAVFMCVKYM